MNICVCYMNACIYVNVGGSGSNDDLRADANICVLSKMLCCRHLEFEPQAASASIAEGLLAGVLTSLSTCQPDSQ